MDSCEGMRISFGDNLPFRMTIGTGITCVIGVVGSALLLVQGARYFSQVSQRRNLRKKRASDANQETSTRSSFCYLCNIRVALEDITTFAICRGCDRTVCRGRRCSDWDRGTGYWECISCIRSRDSQIRAGEWILDQLNQRFKSPRSDTSRDDLSFKDAETQSEGSFLGSAHSISLEQKEKVREFLEDIIASMIGGSLDNVPVNQTHKHPSYLPLQDEEGPGIAHVNLKRLIQKVIEEALNLPDLFNYSGFPPRPESHLPYFSSKKYEQLLATAVLNKVVDHYRNPKNHQENSSGIQSGSEFDSNHNAVTEKTGLLSPTSQKALDKRLEEASQASESSLKTRSTDSDETYLSDYIQKHRVPLPDLSAASSEGTVEDNSSEIASTVGTEGTWEENWLFKKRKVKTDTNSTAIGMLVPSPTEEVKALIGDKNVDEVSDLSEAGSDAEEDHQERPAAKLVESKTIIGGKNELISLEDTSSATESLLSNPDSGINVTEARNEALLDQDFPEPTEAINPTVNGTDAPIPTPRQSTVTENHVTPRSQDLYRENHLSHLKPDDLPEGNGITNSPTFPGDWVLIQGCWEVSDPNQSILVNSGQYTSPLIALTPEEEKLSANHQVLSPDRLFGYKFLNDMKPDTLPSQNKSTDVGVSALRIFSYGYLSDMKPVDPPAQDPLPTPEVELSSTDEFVCVMKYDEKRQLVICGSPQAQRREFFEEQTETEASNDSPQDWEPQVCEKVEEEAKETPPAAEEMKDEDVKVPVPLPRQRSLNKSPEEEEHPLEIRSIIQEDLKKELPVEEDNQVEEFESKLTEIHVRVEEVQEEVKIVEKVEKIEQEHVEIHVRTIEEPEKEADDTEKVTQDSDKAQVEEKKEVESVELIELDEPKVEIHLRTAEVPEIHLRTVDNPEEKEVTKPLVLETEILTEQKIEESKVFSQTTETEEELNAKIAEILEEEEPEEPVKTEDIMSTSQEIKEQLKKIVKSDDEEKPEEVQRPTTLAIEPEDETVHLRYKSPIFQQLLPKSPPPSVVKLSTIPDDDIQKLISVANIIKRSSYSPEEMEREFGDGSTNLTNREEAPKVSTNAESIETVSKPRLGTESLTPEPDSLEDEHLIPGSIAEREHLKWRHPDTDMPNNPYSPEALQQRLVGKTYHSQSSVTSTSSHIESPPKTPERSLQVVLGEESPDYKRYGRDYYINDAKKSSGSRKKQPESLSASEEDKSGLFVATPIRVDETETTGLSIESSETSNTSLQLTDSLTPSEDSDTTRIYEIETRETRLLRESVIMSSKKAVGSTRTPPSTPTEENAQPPAFPISPQAIEEETRVLQEIEEKRTVSPSTVKFFAPKKPPVFSPTTPTAPEQPAVNGSSMEKKEINNNNEEMSKTVIEEEVLSTLPSVKKLMSAFTTADQAEEANKPVHRARPKIKLRTSLPLAADQEPFRATEGKKISPSNGKSPIVPGYSITARSLSKQFRDELKHSTSQEDETPREEERGKRHSSPERPPSPVLVPGRLKSNIAFFENLRNK
ncbi:uncharacterized protein LOC132261281 isoform X2 [Phlebotomus argentipes]|uniref:uncharacterized protein LOC132261281 isoform X2 n=1 Tax=Phlebotomus argentipes TaxID=94469 RepID=UPI002892AD7F|nr:uncharacterized protein LOC132261281 isoform X2 [Phlebotomus argentipes]